MPYRRYNSRRKPRRLGGFALAWHLAWAGAVLAAAGILVGLGRLAPGTELAALAVGAVPALVGAGLALLDARPARVIAILVWTLAGAVACQMTGGTLGPLAAWCLAPLAAAAAFRRSELLSLGAAGAVAAAALASVGTLLMPLPSPSPALAPWFSLLSLSTVAIGLGAGLVSLQGHARFEGRRRDAAEQALREVLDNQPQLLMSVYPGGRILEAFGQAPGEASAHGLFGRNLSELVSPDDRLAVEEALQRAVQDGSAEAAFIPAHDPDGWCVLSLRRMSDIRLVGAVRDARAQKARETELDQARASAESQNAGKSRFLANMSHELRTPLNAIMGFSDIMRQRLFGPMSDRYVEYAELVHESGAHLLELINDILDMSKIEAERFELARETFDARDAISAVLRLMRGQADRAGVTLRGVLPTEPLDADADRRALKQIALNLVSNALKFTPQTGTVTVTVQGAGDVLEIVVADTGVGIAVQDLERLGRPFEQAGDAGQKANGAGLGLSLVRAFARLHGGDMAIESALGEGTTVTVRMPVLRPAALSAPAPTAAPAAPPAPAPPVSANRP
ncbi:HAMP domain-containing sensor histidine kinase [Phenylobacterium sp. J367]|uniref:sensor histidine kinase n=1 Tax=Phenylobacterium sp. J367 TaxID=2898435 RepID=UPI002151F95F|nr:PAS domain-containing sensor histidine kinase [Phenylobacterium sp. J367]MCR5878842.1 PAS domain-containing sensor histidine kinase [Phenylobacterium sp. J367]